MGNIGLLIKKLRETKGISVRELAHNICTEKYIYLIESGTRNPSTMIMEKIGFKLGVDIMEYWAYLDCKNPTLVKQVIDQFEVFRKSREIDKLIQLTYYIDQDLDFMHLPWRYELEFNLILENLMHATAFETTGERIRKAILDLGGELNAYESAKINSVMLLKFYNLYSMYFFSNGEIEEGDRVIKALYFIIEKKKYIHSFKDKFISIATNYYNRLLENNDLGDFEPSIKQFLVYQMKINHLDRVYLTYFLLAYYYSKINEDEKAKKHLKHFINLGEVFGDMNDYTHLLEYPFVMEYLKNKTDWA